PRKRYRFNHTKGRIISGPPCICTQNTGGKGLPPRSSVTQRVSVKVSSDQRPPCLPEPEALTPPNGTCGSSLTDEQFTWQLPVSSWLTMATPRPSFPVITPADKPYSVSLAIWMASSSVRNGITGTTGPKVSS